MYTQTQTDRQAGTAFPLFASSACLTFLPDLANANADASCREAVQPTQLPQTHVHAVKDNGLIALKHRHKTETKRQAGLNK